MVGAKVGLDTARNNDASKYQARPRSQTHVAERICVEDKMKIPKLPFTLIEWAEVAPTVIPGESGDAVSRAFEIGDLRLRMVEYSPSYLADHWCDRGHVLLVLEGELVAELSDGRNFLLRPGASFQVSDFGDKAHRIRTESAAKAFILD